MHEEKLQELSHRIQQLQSESVLKEKVHSGFNRLETIRDILLQLSLSHNLFKLLVEMSDVVR